MLITALAGAALAACSCRRHDTAAQPRATTLPSAAAVTSIDSERYGIHLDWPAGWSPRRSEEFVLELVPADSSGATISLDVPSLPPHLPGMIRIHLVANGFLDDQKKEHGAVQVVEQKDVSIPNSTARRILTHWKSTDGTEWMQDAVLIIHDDRVYIVQGTGRAQDEERVRGVVEKVMGSIRWIPAK